MPITNSKQDWSIGKLGFRATMAKIKQQEREIADLQKEIEALKATIARDKIILNGMKVASSSARWELKDEKANRRGDQVTIERLRDDIKSLKATIDAMVHSFLKIAKKAR